MGQAILLFITTAGPSILFFLIRSLGLGLVTYVGLDIIMDSIITYIFSHYSGLPAEVISIITLLNLDVAIKILAAAYASAFVAKQTVGGINKLVFKS